MIALLVLIAVICWGLNRNHRRVIRTTTNGIPDRDLERLVADLRSLSREGATAWDHAATPGS